MKKAHLFAFVLSAFILPACQSNNNSQTTTSDSSVQTLKKGKAEITNDIHDGCYMQVSGAQMRDTLFVQLHIKDYKVNGLMQQSIYQKDSRKGTIKGTLLPDNTIKAVWQFTQEGITDTLGVEFRLSKVNLLQKPLNFNPKTGRQETDATAGYNIELKPTDCNK